ncbi:tRNA (Mo5U34)-methyltransferase [Rhynchospora pubera]|uniref:tRNA (Mo5U34)-methyltransferase n=1 Tax=Rhynchospora pubera TaxID=906938 RepID=A0AAV8FD10_9POAL|nr:tRNA (Mo5U34)-methyltransferase [Rhynchospora pubera]
MMTNRKEMLLILFALVMGFADTDVGEFFYKKGPTINELVNYLCHDLSEACSVMTPPVPKDRIPGEPFVPKPSKDAEMEKMLRSMQDMPGAPNMKMYSRDDLNEDEDDDDEDNFSNNLGKVFKNKETPNKDLKEKILEGVAEKSKQVKKHIGKASQKIKKWWRGFKKPVKKTPSKSSKSSKTEL